MRIMRMIAGISMFGASAWLAPMISEAFRLSQIFGFVTVGGLMAFIGGAIFYSEVRNE